MGRKDWGAPGGEDLRGKVNGTKNNLGGNQSLKYSREETRDPDGARILDLDTWLMSARSGKGRGPIKEAFIPETSNTR